MSELNGLGNEIANAMLDYAFYGKTLWASLHSASPTSAGDATTEIVGGMYLRCAVQFSNAGGKMLYNITPMVWMNLPECQVTHIAIWDKRTLGTLMVFCQVSRQSAITVSAGDSLRYEIGDYVVRL